MKRPQDGPFNDWAVDFGQHAEDVLPDETTATDFDEHERDDEECTFYFPSPRDPPLPPPTMEGPFAPELFAAQEKWFKHRRKEALDEIKLLKKQLNHISELPFEQRGERFKSILAQADALYHQIERVKMLRGWVCPDASGSQPEHGKLRLEIIATVAKMRNAA